MIAKKILTTVKARNSTAHIKSVQDLSLVGRVFATLLLLFVFIFLRI